MSVKSMWQMAAVSLDWDTLSESRRAAEDVSKTVSKPGCFPPARHRAVSSGAASVTSSFRRGVPTAASAAGLHLCWLPSSSKMPHPITPQATQLAKGGQGVIKDCFAIYAWSAALFYSHREQRLFLQYPQMGGWWCQYSEMPTLITCRTMQIHMYICILYS